MTLVGYDLKCLYVERNRAMTFSGVLCIEIDDACISELAHSVLKRTSMFTMSTGTMEL
jgi:hypothetical protein